MTFISKKKWALPSCGTVHEFVDILLHGLHPLQKLTKGKSILHQTNFLTHAVRTVTDRFLFQKIQNRSHPNRTTQVSNKRFQNPICIFTVIFRFLHLSRCLHSERSTAPDHLSVSTCIGGAPFVRRVYISFSLITKATESQQTAHVLFSAVRHVRLLPPCDEA